MALTIIWTNQAEGNLADIVHFILLTWNDKVLSQFFQELNHSLKIISENPRAFPVSLKEKEKRKCVVTAQISLFYKTVNNELIIESLIDNRANNK